MLINRKTLSSQKDQLILNQSVFSLANDHKVIFPEKLSRNHPEVSMAKKNIQYTFSKPHKTHVFFRQCHKRTIPKSSALTRWIPAPAYMLHPEIPSSCGWSNSSLPLQLGKWGHRQWWKRDEKIRMSWKKDEKIQPFKQFWRETEERLWFQNEYTLRSIYTSWHWASPWMVDTPTHTNLDGQKINEYYSIGIGGAHFQMNPKIRISVL